MRINGLSCCGAAEMAELSFDPVGNSTPGDKLWNFCVSRTSYDPVEGFYYRCRYIMFTQASSPGSEDVENQRGYGFDFAQFIRDNSLGEVVDSIPAGINPNSSNVVKVWMWIPDMTAVRAWLAAEVTRREYKYTPPPPPIRANRGDNNENIVYVYADENGARQVIPPANLSNLPGNRAAGLTIAPAAVPGRMQRMLANRLREAQRLAQMMSETVEDRRSS